MLRRALIGLATTVAILSYTGSAQAVSTNCNVNASGGFANCLSLASPVGEMVKAWHAHGLPYRFQLYRYSDGARWGSWTYSDFDYHAFTLSLGGTITAQVDNEGSGNPSSYWINMY